MAADHATAHATLRVNRALNAAGSDKDTRHFEIDISGSGLSYVAGDSLAVYPHNRPELVDAIIAQVAVPADSTVSIDGHARSLVEALREYVEITKVPKKLLPLLAERGVTVISEMLLPEKKPELDAWCDGRDLVDCLSLLPPGTLKIEELFPLLKALPMRLYSIASGPAAHPESVHLTIAIVRWGANGRLRHGVASSYLADLVGDQGHVEVGVHTAKHFRLPEDGNRPIIMIGPGTGIAPFRGFVQERIARGQAGPMWVFFGDRHEKTDFLYADEFKAWQASGALTKLSLAFSRDQAEKIYVQTRMKEEAATLWQWLEQGAHVYVCGDAKRMAKDVDQALHELIVSEGGKTPEQAVDYVKALKKDKRYQRDVY